MSAFVVYLNTGGGFRVWMPYTQAVDTAQVINDAVQDPARQDATFAINPDTGGRYEIRIGDVHHATAEH